jgi:hypothetical protein
VRRHNLSGHDRLVSVVNHLFLLVLGTVTVVVGVVHFRMAARRASEAAAVRRRLPINGVVAWRAGAIVELCLGVFLLGLAVFPS